MARPLKKSIDRITLDVDFLDDERMRKIVHACGPGSISVIICLLCNICRQNGYYIRWDEKAPSDIADTLGVSEGFIKEVVLKALQVEYFDNNTFRSSSVITSRGIQRRYFEATRKRKCDYTSMPYLLSPVTERQPEPEKSAAPAVSEAPPQPSPLFIVGNDANNSCRQRFFSETNRANIEQLMMNLSLRPDQYEKLCRIAGIIINEWNATETAHRDYPDWSRHLVNLLRIKLQAENKNVKTETSNTQPAEDYSFNGGFGGKDT